MLWRTSEALRDVRALRPSTPEEDDPERVDLEARILEARGEFDDADQSLVASRERACAARIPAPQSGRPRPTFAPILDKVLESLPEVIRPRWRRCLSSLKQSRRRAIARARPSHHRRKSWASSSATTVEDKVFAPSGYPNVVLLYQRNPRAGGRAPASEVTKEIKITLLHE